MNTIVEMCRSDYLMILPEDVQFIVKGDWIDDFVEVLTAFPHLGGICFNAQRRVTIERFFAPRRRLFGLGRAVEPAVYRTASGREFLGYGAAKPGIIGAGILSFARTAVWRDLGRWRATGRQTVADSSGGGEAEMLERYRDAGLRLERCLARIPVCVEIITDSVGSKARIRGNRRYGALLAAAGRQSLLSNLGGGGRQPASRAIGRRPASRTWPSPWAFGCRSTTRATS